MCLQLCKDMLDELSIQKKASQIDLQSKSVMKPSKCKICRPIKISNCRFLSLSFSFTTFISYLHILFVFNSCYTNFFICYTNFFILVQIMYKSSFNYIDSSEQQEKSDHNSYYLKPSPRATQNQNHQKNNKRLQNSSSFKKYSHKDLNHKQNKSQNNYCQMNLAGQKLLNQDFQSNVKDILGRKIQKQFANLLLVEANEKEIQQNLKKRNQKYKQFIRDMQIDQKYQKILEQQVFKYHIQNERKKDVLRRHREMEKMKTQQQLLTKYTIQKEQYQTQVVQRLKKKVRKIGVERVQSAHKNIKSQLLQKRAENRHKLQSKANKQQNQLLELKEELQRLKRAKHVNRIQQQKVLREFQKQVIHKKKELQGKLNKPGNFII